MQNVKRKISIASLMASVLVVSSCNTTNQIYEAHEVETQSDIGQYHIAATHIESWDSYVERLSPNFALTGAQALEKINPTTGYLTKRNIDAFSASAKLGLQLNKAPDPDKPEKPKAEIPGAPAAATDKTNTDGPIALPAELAVDTDPILEYTAATALYQEVQLLNHYVKGAARKRDMKPYIMRMQLTVSPYARHQPYDSHILLSFTTQNDCGTEGEEKKQKYYDCLEAHQEAIAVPLLVTDNIENQLASRSSNTIRKTNAALSLLAGKIALGAELDKRLDKLDAILSKDLNAIMTVGRPSPSSIYVKIGAMQEATAGYAQLSRNYNITFLVMVPKDTNTKAFAKAISVNGSVTIRHNKTGIPLPKTSPHYKFAKMQEVVLNHLNRQDGYSNKSNCDAAKNVQLASLKNVKSMYYDIIRGDYASYVNLFKNKTTGCGQWISLKRDLWNNLTETLGQSGYFGDRIDLPYSAIPELPLDQVIMALDKGGAITVKLAGGKKLTPKNLSATLKMPVVGGGSIDLVANSVVLNGNGSNPTFAFVSLKDWSIKPNAKKGSLISNASLSLNLINNDRYQTQATTPIKTTNYANVYYTTLKNEPNYLYSINKAVELISVGANKEGTIKIHVKFKEKDKKKIASSIELAIGNANLKTAVSVPATAQKSVEFNKVTLTDSATVTFTLENLDKAKKVTLTSLSKDASDKTHEAKRPVIEFTVKQ